MGLVISINAVGSHLEGLTQHQRKTMKLLFNTIHWLWVCCLALALLTLESSRALLPTSTAAEAQTGVLEGAAGEIPRKKINAVRLSYRHFLTIIGTATILYISTNRRLEQQWCH